MADERRVEAGDSWERRTLERLAFAALDEQRRARRWRIFFRLVVTGLLVLLVVLLHRPRWGSQPIAAGGHDVAAIVQLEGTIQDHGAASAHQVDHALRAAFAAHPAGVILEADSPGGSPVQADEMYGQIMRLRKRYPHTPIYAVVGDLCASGCYYVISATNRIYANQASLVGSIGVLMDGFGFTGIMKKLGVQRRLFLAGEDKGFLDPFSPMTAAHRAFIQSMLDQIHQRFIARVEAGRGAALSHDNPRLFSGLAWTGVRAQQLGLIDAFGGVRFVSHHVLKARHLVNFTPQQGLIDRFTQRFGAAATRAVLSDLSGGRPELR